VHPLLGNIDEIKTPLYGADQFIAETRFANVEKAVHVQAAIGIDDPVKETRWLQAFADRVGFPHGIVAHCDLVAGDADAVLARHAEHPNFRGVRDFGQGDYLVDAAWQRGYALLEQYDAVCCLDCVWEGFGKARALAERFPAITLCLDHCGFPRSRDDEYFRHWRAALVDLAGAPNVVVKISGLGMYDNRWTVDSLRPWVLSCIEAFGVERSFFGTNWPVDRMYSSYGDVLDAYEAIIADFAPAERTALFAGNAERVFRI
jgi:predicted TIM-barrel fold metal-dependent hydrolase